MSSTAQQDAELLLWAADRIRAEQDAKTYGSITFYMEGGHLVRSEVKRTDKPPPPPKT